jgi:hypothetical protein
MKTLALLGLRARLTATSAALIITLCMIAAGQTPAELGTGSYGSAGNGPTASQQAGRLLLNASGTNYTTPKANVTVTATISNQQFTGSGTGTGNPVLMFGATNTTGNGSATARPVYASMDDIGSPGNAMYSNQVDGSAAGIDVATNQAFNMYTSVHQWAGLSSPSTNNTRIYIADLTLTFSTPLTNPLLHFVGLGGSTSGGLGFTSELDLTTAGLTMTRLQGDTPFSVTSTQIKNSLTTGVNSSCTANQAACGTVRLNGNNIASVTFKVFVRGDNGAANWGTAANHAGDQWLIGVSIPQTFTISGNVFSDTNGLSDNKVNGVGVGTAGVAQLYANLVEPVSGKIIGTTPVASNGSYSFDGIPAGANVRMEITTNQGTELATAPAKSMPAPWTYVDETIGTGTGSESPADGAQAFQVSGNVTNVNFGIHGAPTAANVNLSGRILTSYGAGIRNVVVKITDPYGNSRTALSTAFGYYNFSGVPSGEVYVVSVTAKQFHFSQPLRVINLNDAVEGFDFVAY